MDQIRVVAHAKINLSLDVGPLRRDGYHSISSVMQSIGLSDGILIRKTVNPLELTVDNRSLPAGPGNLAYKAAMAICSYVQVLPNVHIDLTKRIPIGAGLGGGSADAAGTLLGINKLLDLRLTDEEMFQLALSLGSDVPFCLKGGTFLAEGRGELLTRIPNRVTSQLILYKPSFSVSTATVYEKYDSSSITLRPSNVELMALLKQGRLKEGFPYMHNVLESVTFKLHPHLPTAKEKLDNAGADYVLMSGSGPTLIAFYETEMQRNSIMHAMQDMPGRTYLTKFVDTGQEICSN